MRQRKSTRGKRPAKRRAYLSTKGNFEVQETTLAELCDHHSIPLGPDEVLELTALVNWRIMEVRTPYLTLDEASKPVSRLVSAARETTTAIRDIAALGENDIGLSLGDGLLGDLDYDFNRRNYGNRMIWQEVCEYLDSIAENIERKFVSHDGGKQPYYDFIEAIWKIFDRAGFGSNQRIGSPASDKFLIALGSEFDGLVFPEDTAPHTEAREEYLRNVRRSL